MTTSFIIAVVIIAAALGWMILSGKKQKRHLDDLHITADTNRTPKDS